MSELSETTIDTPVGELTLIASAAGLRGVLWRHEHHGRHMPHHHECDGRTPDEGGADGAEQAAHAVLASASQQLQEYFAGVRTSFDLPLDPVGSEFQKSAWQALRTIPYGETVSYGEQARRMGDARKARAVGAANGKNPISIVVPCHRVVGADGSLTGFGGGIENKAWLLDHERAVWARTLD